MSPTQVLYCSCKHDFQDATYGKNMRVFNVCGKGSQKTGYRCTVCGNKIPIPTTKK